MAAATNRLSLRFVKETTFGITPAATQTNVRFSGESLKQDTSTASSTEIQSDRQIPGIVRSAVGASGDINYELYMGGSLETLMTEGAMQSGAVTAAATDSSTTSSIDVTAINGRFSAATGNPFISGYSIGDWVKVTGFSNAGNNGYFRIIQQTGSQLTFGADASTFVDETDASGHGLLRGAYYSNGTTQNSYSIEKEWGDLASTFSLTKGCVIDGQSLTVPADGIITGSISLLGKQSASTTSSADSGTHGTAGSGAVLSGIDNIIAFSENGTQMTITGFNFTMTNNLRQRNEVGSAFAVSVGAGSLGVTGSFQAYFAAGTPVSVIDRYLAGTNSSISCVFTDGTNQVAIDFPRVRLTSGQRVAGGQNQDVILEVGFEAFKNETSGHTMRYTKW